MNYLQTLDFLYSKLPMFTRVGASAFKKDLTNTIILCEALDNPQNKFKTIHVAGTNGKGSTSHMIAAILQAQGFKTGLYTSPHLKDFRERIRINGKMISRSDVKDFVRDHKKLIETTEPSFFEVTVAMAFDHFAKNQVDIAVIEVGLGGRLDSTNIIQPEISVITNISLDHTNMLGNTLPEIAAEKAGIIKKNTPVVIGETQEDSFPVFKKKARDMDAGIFFADTALEARNIIVKSNRIVMSVYQDDVLKYGNVQCDLTGRYQPKNILTVIKALEVLSEFTETTIVRQAVFEGLKNVKKLTQLQGRWQTLNKVPLTICDTGHNEAGIKEVVLNIEQTPHKNLHMVIGMVKDKEISTILMLLPKNARYYFCKPDLERGLDANELLAQAKVAGLSGDAYPTVLAAKQAAEANAEEKDLIFIGGSTFVVAEAL